MLSFVLQKSIITLFHKLNIFQSIYELSPEKHQQKQKTPSLGGIGLLITFWAGIICFPLNPLVVWIATVYTAFSILGAIDDISSVFRKKNQGLTSVQKAGFQVLFSFILLTGYAVFIKPITLLQCIGYMFVMVGTSNATNLTDGLDGLLTGCSLVTLAGFSFLLSTMPTLFLQSIPLSLGLGLIVFYVFNRHPAKIFMGDTGSLAIGACFAAMAIVIGNVWILLPLGFVYILETLSVMVQVIYFKRTKRRVFLMAPLHHHFELLGMDERRVVILFWGLSLIGALGILLYS